MKTKYNESNNIRKLLHLAYIDRFTVTTSV